MAVTAAGWEKMRTRPTAVMEFGQGYAPDSAGIDAGNRSQLPGLTARPPASPHFSPPFSYDDPMARP